MLHYLDPWLHLPFNAGRERLFYGFYSISLCFFALGSKRYYSPFPDFWAYRLSHRSIQRPIESDFSIQTELSFSVLKSWIYFGLRSIIVSLVICYLRFYWTKPGYKLWVGWAAIAARYARPCCRVSNEMTASTWYLHPFLELSPRYCLLTTVFGNVG
jgi:hypothetical protein